MTRDHIIGAALGIGIAATGFYLYKKNQDKTDEILRSHGMDIPVNENKPLNNMSVEELATLKEKIEDIIAERELAAESGEAAAPAEEKPKAKRRRRKTKAAKVAPAAEEQPAA